ncbi:MAG: hypothetical protein LBK59_08265, partial [Bifidobacteriaceae bacterium]|nr:hypothetical protein [Bifidobacteriaceae bacterium]
MKDENVGFAAVTGVKARRGARGPRVEALLCARALVFASVSGTAWAGDVQVVGVASPAASGPCAVPPVVRLPILLPALAQAPTVAPGTVLTGLRMGDEYVPSGEGPAWRVSASFWARDLASWDGEPELDVIGRTDPRYLVTERDVGSTLQVVATVTQSVTCGDGEVTFVSFGYSPAVLVAAPPPVDTVD